MTKPRLTGRAAFAVAREWQRKRDTCFIAEKLRVTEYEVYNTLAVLRHQTEGDPCSH
jgi:hypothetical protein